MELTKCKLCGTPEGEPHPFQHPFTTEDQEWVPPKKEKKRSDAGGRQTIAVLPAPDLALRRLLVTKGLITSRELEEVERELVTGQSTTGTSDGETAAVSADERSDR